MDNYEKIIKENAQKYYTTGTQELSDDVFDVLVDEVRKYNPESEVLTTGWGYELDSAKNKCNHKYGHVGSLTKVRTFKEITDKLKITDNIDVSAKLDGMSVVLYYSFGKLNKAVTRGDGTVGIDITDKVKYLIGDTIKDETFTGAVRGEILICPKEFEEFKTKYPEAKNHRNSAIGIINGDEITEDFKYLKLGVYSMIAIELDSNFTNNSVTIESTNSWLESNFKCTAPRVTIDFSELNYAGVLEHFKKKWEKDFNIDGLVLSTPYLTYNPSNHEIIQKAVAYKFPEEIKLSKVTGIEWNMSKNGEYIPVVQIEPVVLAGTTVKRATGFNARFIKENKIGIGATIAICKRGEIIPNVKEVVEPAKTVELPEFCNHCGQKLVWDTNKVNLICVNENCCQKNKEDLKAWCMNLAPVEGLGWKTIEKVLKFPVSAMNNLVDDVTIDDLFNINPIPGVTYGHGEQGSFNQMIDILQNGKFTVSQFLLALNIPGLGKISAKRWEESKNAIKYLDYVANTSMDYDQNFVALTEIVQDKNVVFSLRTTYHDKFSKYYNMLKDRIINSTVTTTNSMKGSVVITGALSIKRADFEKLLENNGWKLSSSLNKDTKFLITNTPESGTSKNVKANELGVTKITEDDFVKNYMN